MKSKVLFCCLIFTLVFGTGMNQAIAQPADSGQPDMAAMVKMWEEKAAPVEQHELLAKMVGTWDATLTMWMDPAAPPTTSTGVSTFSMMFGGRYLIHDYEGTAFGKVFKGRGITGYDKFRREFIDLWYDDMSTGILISRGVLDSTGTMICYNGKMDDPMAGLKDMPCRSDFTTVDADTRKIEMYVTGPDSTEMKTMEIVYKRRK